MTFLLDRSETQHLSDFWFDKFRDRWFGCSNEDDEVVSKLFDHYDHLIRGRLNDHKVDFDQLENLLDIDTNNEICAKSLLCLILIYDQFWRHYTRYYQEPRGSIDPYSTLTNCLAKHLLVTKQKSSKTQTLFDLLSPEEQTFVLLPFRHTKRLDRIQLAYLICSNQQKRVQQLDSNNRVYQRFLKATIKDWERHLTHYGTEANADVVEETRAQQPQVQQREIQIQSNQIREVGILDLSRFSPIMRKMIQWGLVSLTYTITDPSNHLTFQSFRKKLRALQDKGQIGREIAVSFSGGVDSTLCLYFALQMKKLGDLDRVVAIHINYDNRGRSSQEAEFVTNWCRYFGVPLYLRKITEIHREHSLTDRQQPNLSSRQLTHNLIKLSETNISVTESQERLPSILGEDDTLGLELRAFATSQMTSRNFYESYTRHVRYDLYRQVGLPVLLGHNRDDCFENIFTNISKGQHYDNLTAMSTLTQGLYGVSIIRPFLTVNKAEIVQTSRSSGLFHTQNSTPVWSQRYRLRNGVIDYLNQKSPEFLLGLERLSENLQEMVAVQEVQIQEVLNQVDTRPLPKFVLQDRNLLRRVLISFAHRKGVPAPGHRTVDHAYQMIQQKMTRTKGTPLTMRNKTVLSKELQLVETEHGYLISLR